MESPRVGRSHYTPSDALAPPSSRLWKRRQFLRGGLGQLDELCVNITRVRVQIHAGGVSTCVRVNITRVHVNYMWVKYEHVCAFKYMRVVCEHVCVCVCVCSNSYE